ncbi:MAG: hypothetical protein ABI645_04050 [Pseudomonadota bacterium]
MKQTQGAGSGIWASLAAVMALVVSPVTLAQRPVIPVAEAPSLVDAPLLPVTAATEKSADQLQELDEVVVTGGRLYDRIVKAEDKFFKLYNELNDDDDFDTNCANVPIDKDSRLEQRFCMPSFFADAKAEQVRLSQYCLSLQQKDEDGNVTSNGVCYEPPTAEQIFFHRRDDYVDNMIKVINDNKELKQLAAEVEGLHRERAQYENRYEQLRAQKVSEQGEKNRSRPTVH